MPRRYTFYISFYFSYNAVKKKLVSLGSASVADFALKYKFLRVPCGYMTQVNTLHEVWSHFIISFTLVYAKVHGILQECLGSYLFKIVRQPWYEYWLNLEISLYLLKTLRPPTPFPTNTETQFCC